MKALLIALASLVLSILPAAAQDWAIEGYDVVSYVAQGRPEAGRSDISTMWKGKVWHFATEENRARFEADPRAFAPGFSGNCPVSLAEGRQEPGNPQYFMIFASQLYLFRSSGARKQMQEHPRDTLARAQSVWAALR